MTAPGVSYVHASVVLWGERGILIEGASGSGKSSLAAALVDEAAARGRFGRLVGDDRVSLEAVHGRLVARPHPRIAGLLERRGQDILPVAHEAAGVVHLVVRLVSPADRGARLPAAAPTWNVAGITLPLLLLPAAESAWASARQVAAALALRAGLAANKLANSTAMHNIAPHEAAAGMLRDQLER